MAKRVCPKQMTHKQDVAARAQCTAKANIKAAVALVREQMYIP